MAIVVSFEPVVELDKLYAKWVAAQAQGPAAAATAVSSVNFLTGYQLSRSRNPSKISPLVRWGHAACRRPP
jgi:hypothetical protein